MKKVLLIEDNRGDVVLIEEMLQEAGSEYALKSADRLASGLRLLEERRYDIILLDLGLPDSNGIETVNRIQEKNNTVPIIVLTGLQEKKVATSAIALGVQDYLVKGKFESGLLFSSMLYAIERKRLEEDLKRLNKKTTLILESAGQGIFGVDAIGSQTFINKAALRMLGYRAEELIGKKGHAIYHHSRSDGSPYPPEECPVYAAFREGTVHSGEEVFWRKDGSKLLVEFTSNPVFENDKVVGAVVTFSDISERKDAEKARAYLSAIVESTNVAIVSLAQDLNGTIQTWNKGAEKVYGYKSSEVIGRNLSLLIPPGYPNDILKILKIIKRGESIEAYEAVRMRKDGSLIYVALDVSPIVDPAGHIIGASTIAHDITERKLTEGQLEVSEKRFRSMADNISQLAWMADAEGRRFWYNKRWYDYTGTSFEEMQASGWQKVHHPDHVKKVMKKISYCFKNGIFWEDTFPLRGRDGQYRWFLSRAVPIKDEAGKVVQWFGTNTDITEMREMENEITHLAHHDPLSGLPNRRLFRDVAAIEVSQAKRNARKLALFYMDLDRFKAINDTFGHEAGDSLLKEAAQRLRAVVRSSDTVARLGGDEFTLLVADMDHAEYAYEVASKILLSMRKPFLIGGRELNISTSIGISIFPDDAATIETLLQYADIAMYYAKEQGRNTFRFYSPEINTRSLERAQFENDLHRAIERNEFRLYFQPVVDLKTKKIVSAEALLRWEHPEKGLLLPDQFFAAARDTGLMTEIEQWVLKNAGKQIELWSGQQISPPRIAVNVSAQQFRDVDLVARVSRIIQEACVTLECLDIEITESAAMENVESSIQQIQELKKVGVEISIDDFGTGYSSLNQLKRLPIQKIKLDQSFVRDMVTDTNDRKIVTAVLLLAHSLDLKVIAEGVENEDQLKNLQMLKCDEAQGNLFSRPLPAEEFLELIAA